MTKAFPLQQILELMHERADEATQQLARLIAAERDARSKLEMLQQYRGEYATRFSHAAQRGLTHSEWQNYQGFLSRLDEAIDSQQQIVAQQERSTAEGQQNWQVQQRKVKAFDTLSDRHVSRENAKELKREQKLQDEFSARKTFDKINATDTKRDNSK